MKRLADPYRDTDVIDSRAPRTNQAVIGTLALVAVLTGWWPLVGVLALQLAIGLTFGRRFCVACLAYFELIQPRFGEGPLEDARPPRAANVVGLITHCTGKRRSSWLRSPVISTVSRCSSSVGPAYQDIASVRSTTLSPFSAETGIA